MPGVKGDIEKELGKATAGSNGAGSTAGKSIGDRILGGMGGVLKAGVIGMGALAAAGLGTALVKGFQRLDALDQASAKLSGLGHSAQGVDEIMTNALNSVKGTAYGMGDAATVAAQVVAAGVAPGEELERTLKLVGDAATIAGTDMGSMGSIISKVATSDMMQMDVANQLMDAGIPILQMVAGEMGVTAEEARTLASEGKVSFETFQSALESGLGGAALESGNTFSGAMDNVMASLGRLGESLLGGAFEGLKTGFGDLTTTLDDLQPTFEEIGTKVGEFAAVAIPALIDGIEDTVKWLQDAGQWIQDNKTWLGPLAAAVGGAALAFGAWQTAIALWSGVTKIATGVQVAFNAVMNANPIMLIVTAVAALVAGLVYFFTQTELGKEIWANFTQFLTEAWDNVTQFLGEAWDNIVGFFTDSGDNVSTAWNDLWTGISDFFGGIWEGIKEVFQTALAWVVDAFLNWTLLGLIIQNWEPISGFFQGIWDGILGIFTWVWEAISGVVQLQWDVLVFIFQAIADWLNDKLGPVFEWLGEVVDTVWQGILTAIDAVKIWFTNTLVPWFKTQLENLAKPFRWIHENVIVPAWEGIQSGINAVKDWFANTLVPWFKTYLENLAKPFKWLHENVITPAWDGIKSAIKSVGDWFSNTIVPAFDKATGFVGDAFNTLKDVVGKAWEAIKKAAVAPVNFVINTVYNDGIKAMFDKIAEAVGSDAKLPTAKPIKLASGGVLPGYTPGRDVHEFWSPTAGALHLSGGEGIIRPDALQRLGGKAWLDSVNNSRGRTSFADGGIWDWVGDSFNSTMGWLSSAAENIGNVLADPLGAVKNLILTPVKNLLRDIGGGMFGDIIGGLPLKAVDWISDWLESFSKENAPAGGPALARVQAMLGSFPGLMVTSTYRSPAENRAVGGHPNSYHMDAANPAVDVAGPWSQMNNFAAMARNMGGWRQILWQVAGHYDHVHVANQGGVFGDLPYRKYDSGGYIEPGLTLVDNQTGRPEPVFTGNQWDEFQNGRGVVFEEGAIQINEVSHPRRTSLEVLDAIAEKVSL